MAITIQGLILLRLNLRAILKDLTMISDFVYILNLIRSMQHPGISPGPMQINSEAFVKRLRFSVMMWQQVFILKRACVTEPF